MGRSPALLTFRPHLRLSTDARLFQEAFPDLPLTPLYLPLILSLRASPVKTATPV